MKTRIVTVGFGLALSLCSACAPDAGREPDEDRAAQAIVRTTNSPFCPGKTLDSCPSSKAAKWRTDIHEWVEADVPESEIRERLQERVPGFDLKPKPVTSGWLIPLAALVLSTLWFVVMSSRLRRKKPARRQSPLANDATFDARLDEELAQID